MHTNPLELAYTLQANMALYAFHWDDREAAAWADLFAPDGEFLLYNIGDPIPAIQVTGRDNLYQYALDKFATLGDTRTHHHQSGFYLDSRAEGTANTRVEVVVTHQTPDQATPNLAYSGIYRDQWVLIDGLWKFAQRAFYP